MVSNREDLTQLCEDLLPYPIQCTEVDEIQPGELVFDLREDLLPYPIQCTDSGDVLPGEVDFLDLRLDVLPVQCTEPSIRSILRWITTLAVCLDILMREFHALVCCQDQS